LSVNSAWEGDLLGDGELDMVMEGVTRSKERLSGRHSSVLENGNLFINTSIVFFNSGLTFAFIASMFFA